MATDALMAGDSGALPLPWLAEPLAQVLDKSMHRRDLFGRVRGEILRAAKRRRRRGKTCEHVLG